MDEDSAEDADVGLPLPKPKAGTTCLKPSKSSALDGLLKEKKSRQKKYGPLMSPGTVIGEAAVAFSSPSQTLTGEVDDSPTTARRFFTPGAEASLKGVLDQPDKIKEILAGDLEHDKLEEMRRLEAERITRNTFWKDTVAPGKGRVVAAAAVFPGVACKTPVLKSLQQAAKHDGARVFITPSPCSMVD